MRDTHPSGMVVPILKPLMKPPT